MPNILASEKLAFIDKVTGRQTNSLYSLKLEHNVQQTKTCSSSPVHPFIKKGNLCNDTKTHSQIGNCVH